MTKNHKVDNGDFDIFHWLQFHNTIPLLIGIISLVGFIYGIKATADAAQAQLVEVKQQHIAIFNQLQNLSERIVVCEQKAR